MLSTRELKTQFRSCQSITSEVSEIVSNSGVKDGLCTVSLPHTTAGLAITSFWDKRGLDDLMDEIDRNIPTRVSYKHQDSPYNASGHVKSSMFGTTLSLIIKDSKLILGSSQGILLVDFDGPRIRKYNVQCLKIT